MRSLPSILSTFHNKFDKFKNPRALMLDSIYATLDIKILNNHIFVVKTSRFCHLLGNFIMDVIRY